MENARKLAQKKADLAPKQIEAWRTFSRTVFQEGALDEKSKQLIAVAVAHVTQCPYCIRAHTPQAMRKGATKEEIMEAIWVAAAGRASGAYTHASIAVDAMEGNAEAGLYPTSTPEMARKKADLALKQVEAWRPFSNAVFTAGALDEKTKQLIALAISHVTQCANCIKGHTKTAQLKGASNEQMMEAIWVAAEMRAGAAYAHASIAMEEMEKFS
ncbi:carboxymuconolactone decarboxylase family protein [Gelidibacter mesophilus]|uniref:carboxymuconolactone decarboxylase family protein n=1 Tax=Gelidibacter mesophilus TaxID=169050 RepID=UPI00041ABF5D|nr:carboxymuconolactone decarboxylase family protein [Gelidibacter mesophilus]